MPPPRGDDSSNINFIYNINAEFEKSFKNAAVIAGILGLKDEEAYALKRAISYNHEYYLEIDIENRVGHNSIKHIVDKVNQFTRELNISPFNENLRERLGFCYLLLGNFPNSYSAYASIIKNTKNEKSQLFWYAAGVVYSHFGYNERAILFFKKCLEMKPDLYLKSDIGFRMGILFRQSGDLSKSTDSFLTISTPPDGLKMADVQLQIAHNYSLMKNYEQFTSMYQEIFKDSQPKQDVINQFYIDQFIYHIDHTKDDLRKFFDDIGVISKSEPSLLMLQACILLKLKDYKKSYDLFKHLIIYCSDNPYYWIIMGNILFYNEQYDDALSNYHRAIYLKLDLPEAWCNIGSVYEKQKIYDEALKIYQTGLQHCSCCQELMDKIYNLGCNNKVNDTCLVKDEIEGKFLRQLQTEFSKYYISSVPFIRNTNLFDGDSNINYGDFSTVPVSNFM